MRKNSKEEGKGEGRRAYPGRHTVLLPPSRPAARGDGSEDSPAIQTRSKSLLILSGTLLRRSK